MNQHRLGSHETAAEGFKRAIGLMGRARAEWKARGDEKRAEKLAGTIRKHSQKMRASEAIKGEPRARRLGRLLIEAVTLVWALGLWINALVESWSIPSMTRWWLLGGLLVTAVLCGAGFAARWRLQTLGLLASAMLLAALLASFVLHPTLGTGGAVALGLESYQLAHLTHLAALALPIFYALRWWSVFWVPVGLVAVWSMLPFALGLLQRLPIEDLPLQVAFWSEWPGWLQPLSVMVFVYVPACIVLVALTTLAQLIASDAAPDEADLVEAAPAEEVAG